MEEIEHLRVVIDEKNESGDQVPILPTKIILSPKEGEGREGKPRFPPRTSSAQDLLGMYNQGEKRGESLATELLKTQVQNGVKSELTREYFFFFL